MTYIYLLGPWKFVSYDRNSFTFNPCFKTICPTTEHPNKRGPAWPQNTLFGVDLPHHGKTLLTVDLPHHGITNSPCPTAGYPSPLVSAPSQNTLLTVDLLHNWTPYSPWTRHIWNTLINERTIIKMHLIAQWQQTTIQNTNTSQFIDWIGQRTDSVIIL